MPKDDDENLLHLGRRGFLQLGAAAVAGAAILAACGGDPDGADDADGAAGDDAAGDGEGEGDDRSDADVRTLRTAASIELAAVELYQKAIDGGLLASAAAIEAAKAFQDHHEEHAALFNGAAKGAGGEAVEQPNSVVQLSLQTILGQARDEAGVLNVALQLENTATASYLSYVGRFDDAELNRAAMSVGGVAARHAAVLAALLRQPAATKAFFTVDGAVAAGTGL